MKMKFNFKGIFKKVILLIIGIYLVITFINQQKKIDSYDSNIDYLSSKIDEQNDYKDELNIVKDNINSPEYIEEVAREKLNMYMPNEKVYIDIGS